MSEIANLHSDVSALIGKIGVASVIRAVTAHCHAEYERRNLALYKATRERFPDGEPDEDEISPATEDLRRERDEASALLFVDLNWAAEQFEERIRKAGWTRKQRCEDERATEIIKKKAELERLEKTECA